MASKVLGQYDLAPDGTPALLLVAPNMMAVAGELGVDRDDFRKWVCMHEETHRVQFTANPWLRDHMVEQARSLAVDLAPDPEKLHEIAGRVAEKLPELFREGGTGLADLFTTPEQREKLAGLTAVMSLLEGHADVVMDDVGPRHIPTVAHIRARFSERRKGAGAPDRLLRRLLGLEARCASTATAPCSCAGHERVGVEGFNAIWTSPGHPAAGPRDRGTGGLGAPHPRLTTAPDPHLEPSPVGWRGWSIAGIAGCRDAVRHAVRSWPTSAPATSSSRRAVAARTRSPSRPRSPSRRRPAGCAPEPSSSTTACSPARPGWRAARAGCLRLGLDPVDVVTVEVESTGDGLEAAAR